MLHKTGIHLFLLRNTTETSRLFFRRRAKQLPLQRNIFELSPRDLSLTPQIAFLHIPEN